MSHVSRNPRLRILALGTIAAALLAAGRADACWVCSQTNNSTIECENSTVDSGGNDCTLKCKTSQVTGASFCTCSTGGVCTPRDVCEGPCPTGTDPGSEAEASDTRLQQERLERAIWEAHQSERLAEKGIFRLPESLWSEMESEDLQGAMLLAAITDEARGFRPGVFQGFLTHRPEGKPEEVLASYQASVVREGAWLDVRLQVKGHPHIRSISARVAEDGQGARIEIQPVRGPKRTLQP